MRTANGTRVRDLEDYRPTCPHCGSKLVDTDAEEAFEGGEEDEIEGECGECGEGYTPSRPAWLPEREQLGEAETRWRDAYVAFKMAIIDALGAGASVSTELGIFFVHRGEDGIGRNPQTGAPMTIVARTVPHFAPSARLWSDTGMSVSLERVAAAAASGEPSWDLDADDVVADYGLAPVPSRADGELASPTGLYDDVLEQLKSAHAARLGGVGSFVLARVRGVDVPERLLRFRYERELYDRIVQR